ICRLIVEGHGGRIWARSAGPDGSTFSLLLPVHPPRPGAGNETGGQAAGQTPAAADAPGEGAPPEERSRA
ncbi:MAG TPA: hypothetical protein VFO85_03395, partial [Vicinamibacteria bacterium]|nr:hypothetical protein [Vicinamibacteria bacterium]